MAHSQTSMVALLLTSAAFVAHGMEPFAGPLAAQTVWQAGEPVPVIVSYDVPQFGLLDELTKLKEASDAEEALSQQREIAVEEPSALVARRGSSFLAKKMSSKGFTRGPSEAVHDLEDLISRANAANAATAEGSRSEPKALALDADMVAAAKEATDKLTSLALKFDEAMYPAGTSLGFSPEEAEVHEKLRLAMSSGSAQASFANRAGAEEGPTLSLIDEAPSAGCGQGFSQQCPNGWMKKGRLCVAGQEYSGPCKSSQDVSTFGVEQKRAFAVACKVNYGCEP